MSSQLVAFFLLGLLSVDADPSWTVLPNTRCHDDEGQTHTNVTTLESCEEICLTIYSGICELVSFCPPGGAAECSTSDPSGPQPGCWFFPYSELSSCENTTDATGWTSAFFLPPPPTPPPADWEAMIASGDMVFSALPPSSIGEGFFPVVGNGFLALEMGPFTQAWVNSWPWRDSGSFHLAGVYTGEGWTGPSHRAQIPKMTDLTLLDDSQSSARVVGAAISYSEGIYYNRTYYNSTQCADTIVEQRSYAHRLYRELFVMEIQAFPAVASSGGWAGCTIPISWSPSPLGPDTDLNVVTGGDTDLNVVTGGDTDLNVVTGGDADLNVVTGGDAAAAATVMAAPPASSAAKPTLWCGTTLAPEEPSLPNRSLAVAFDSWISEGLTTLVFTPSEPTLTLRVVLRSDLDVPGGAAQVPAAAVASWQNFSAMSSASLLASHTAAWASLWASGGIELTGNGSFAATVNASLYDIVSSLRSDWNWSTSPGGLGTGGYCGHHFWDMETWMMPITVTLFPSLARVAAQYRIDRLPASLENAALLGFTGACWAWESAFTGLWTAPWRGADTNENHISADIPLSWRKYFYATGDVDFLAEAWPALNATCEFWACRFTRTDSVGPPGWGGGELQCKGWRWKLDGAKQMAASPFLPLSSTLYTNATVHAQYPAYNGHEINQADVALLQFPLGISFDPTLMRADLDYYSTKTDFAGMFTGDSSYSCAYLGLGVREAADLQLNLAFGHIDAAFNVFTETEVTDGGHTQHFITGAGGFLQNFVFGYSGLRIKRQGVFSFDSLGPVLPPYNISQVKLRGLHLLGSALDFIWTNTSICAAMQQGLQPAPLQLRILGTNKTLPLPPAGGSPVCVPVQPVEISGVGFL